MTEQYRDCHTCKGEGFIWQKVKPYCNARDSVPVDVYTICPIQGCERGKVKL